MVDFNDFSKSCKDNTKLFARLNKRNKAVVFDALAAGGVTRVTAEFDGEGDSGQLGNIDAYAGDRPAKLPATSVTLRQAQWNNDGVSTDTMTLEEAIQTLCYDYLEQKHGGWENNDGAYGTFEFDIGNRTVSFEFNERFIDATTYNHTL